VPTGEGGLCNADESKKYLAMSYAFLVAFYQNHKSLESAQKSLMSMVRKGDRVIGHLQFSAPRFGSGDWELVAEERK